MRAGTLACLALPLFLLAACSTDEFVPQSNDDAAADAPPATDAGTSCEASRTACGTTCTDRATDPQNCGACGHACSVGACQSGACASAPVVPIANVAYAHGLELDGAYVYYTTSDFAPSALNVVARVPKNGGNSQPLASPEAAPQNLAVRGGIVYWTNWSTPTVRAVDPTNAAGTRRTVADLTGVASGLFGITTSPTDVFVASNVERYVYALPRTGTIADAGALPRIGEPTGKPPTGQLFQTVADDTTLFWTAAGADGVQSVPLSDTTKVKRWVTDAISPWGLALSNDYIVYTDRDARRVVRVRRSDGSALVLASQNLGEPRGVTIDGAMVYFCDFGAGIVYRVPLDGSAAPSIVADNQSGALLVRADADAVYWTRYHPALGGVYKKQK